MIRRKQPPALRGDDVLGVLKLHWRATESRLAVQMRERGVQAVLLEHAAFMEALFQVNPSGVYNKTFLRDVVTQWCRFHSLPWTTTEIRQEAFALKVLQSRVLRILGKWWMALFWRRRYEALALAFVVHRTPLQRPTAVA
jgi:hypothetical protein